MTLRDTDINYNLLDIINKQKELTRYIEGLVYTIEWYKERNSDNPALDKFYDEAISAARKLSFNWLALDLNGGLINPLIGKVDIDYWSEELAKQAEA